MKAVTSRETFTAVARLAAICGVLIALYAVLPFKSEHWLVGAAIGLAAIAAIVPLTIKRVERIETAARPAFAVVEALLLIVAMLVFGFAGLYLTIDRNGDEFAGLDTRIDAVYFTVETLSTVGYGDIHPTGQTARVFVTGQILLDFTLFAFAIKVVTATARSRMGRDAPTDLVRRSRDEET